MVKEVTMKQTEIGLIPEDWEVKELGRIAEIINGRAYSQNELLQRGKYKVLRVGNFFSSDKWYWSDLELPNKFYVCEGDLMYAWSASFGPKFWNNEKTIYHYHIWKVETSKTLNKVFLFHLFEQDKENILKQSQGGTMFHITKEAMEKRKFPLPPLPEQEAIAEALSDCDAWIDGIEQLLAKKRLIKQGAMQELLTPKGDWEVKKLGEILEFGSGRDYKHMKQGDIPVYGTGGIMTYVDDFLYNGDSVGIGRKGTIDKPVFLTNKFWTVDTLFYTHSFHYVTAKYIYYQFLQIPWKEYNEASGVPSLNKNTLEQIEIKIPSFSEQNRIASILSDMEAELESLEQKLEKAKMIKQGMMQELLTGRTRIMKNEG
jgi:type I restriction enzyme S subunit